MKVLSHPGDNSRNPYVHLLNASLREFGVDVDDWDDGKSSPASYDVLHVHWPDLLIASTSPVGRVLRWLGATGPVGRVMRWAGFALWLRAAKAAGLRLVWTAHNVQPHESALEVVRAFQRWFVSNVDGVMSLSRSGITLARDRFEALERVPQQVVPHGHYRDLYPRRPDQLEARRSLDLAPESTVLLYFGSIREYKGVPDLLSVFLRVRDPDATLVIAGKPRTARLRREVGKLAATDSRVHLHLRSIPESDVPKFFAAADVVVLPFRDILHSGSAMLALSLDRPVIAPRSDFLEELSRTVGAGWLRLYDGAIGRSILEEALSSFRNGNRSDRPNLTEFDWPPIARATAHFYEQVAS